MRSLNRVLLTALVFLAAAALAVFLRARGDSHRLGGATDLDGSLEPVQSVFNQLVDQPRLVMVLAPACPVCLEGAETVDEDLLRAHPNLQVLAIWMEALPFDITRNPARRIETFADEPRMRHFYDMQQVAGGALLDRIDWRDDSVPWDVFMLYPPGVVWDGDLPEPTAWFHQRGEANADRYRTGNDLAEALQDAVGAL